MGELQTKATRTSVDTFIGAIKDEGRRKDCEEIGAMMITDSVKKLKTRVREKGRN